ncbi:MAG: nucleotide-binding protein [Bacteroidales bacterium]|jgi:hypothetical protein|nr:nucleotide-binding protein [Bacteroidales bacterium]
MKKIYRKPKVFIGSTIESISYTEALTKLFSKDEIDIVTWNLHFESTDYASTFAQLNNLKNYDFGIIIFTPDDKLRHRDKNYDTPRDNTIFELGLLIGYLGEKRVFPIIPNNSDLKLPSDLLGINTCKFDFSTESRLTLKERQIALQDAYFDIKDKIISRGPKDCILIHDKIMLNKIDTKIKFKIGFTGPNSMINVKLTLNLIKIYKDENGYYGREWTELKLSKVEIPEIRLSWNLTHKISNPKALIKKGTIVTTNEKSILLELLTAKEKTFLQNLKALTNYRIRLDLNGYNSATMEPVHATRIFKFNDIFKGDFARFYEMNESGEIINNTIDWLKFPMFNKEQ